MVCRLACRTLQNVRIGIVKVFHSSTQTPIEGLKINTRIPAGNFFPLCQIRHISLNQCILPGRGGPPIYIITCFIIFQIGIIIIAQSSATTSIIGPRSIITINTKRSSQFHRINNSYVEPRLFMHIPASTY